ncbi:MAG TPA: adenosylcobalamin-dependent ribonucleoside-diphosphate reductase, partial [Candidatus Manganitrophaceae bacterium]|nr:adenosylcobalamin-dependent ribonucleoside-diphosphate reductase [Candidatus Manganitrophaceae bacterium]
MGIMPKLRSVRKRKRASLTPNALTVLEKRYLKKDGRGRPVESPDEMFRRVAENVAAADARYRASDVAQTAQTFYDLLASLEFLPNSPTLMNAGRELQQLSACFVLPVEDSLESIFGAIKNTAMIHQSGGGTGFSFSRIRPKNDLVLSTSGVASGPVSFMRVFNMATEVIKQGGTRRGANMGILRVDHPDIMEFIRVKEDPKEMVNFNLSVALTERFMEAVRRKETYRLINPRTKKEVDRLFAKEVFDQITQSAWLTGEPGIIFIDRMNRYNPTPSLGAYEATNPCGEQPLLPYESCNLGSINLSKMLSKKGKTKAIDYPKLQATIWKAVHFLDNVIDQNQYPLPEIAAATYRTRKIGLGVMGFADLLIELGIPYDTTEALAVAHEVMAFVRREAREASASLAKERGVFPAYDQSIYAEQGIRLRNATTTTIAPTGTISIIAGCSSGIEPLYALSYSRHVLGGIRLPETNSRLMQTAKAKGFYSERLFSKVDASGSVRGLKGIPKEIQELFATAHDISPEFHMKMQAAFQKYTDNAVSKTVNFRREATPHEVERVFLLA